MYFYFLLISTLIKRYDKKDIQNIIDKAHGMIVIIIINIGDISINEFSSVQLHIVILSSPLIISVIFIYK